MLKMFSILQKPPDTVKAEDLETLQNEIERCLVETVTKKWDLEKELFTLDSPSPDPSIALNNAVATSNNSNNHSLSQSTTPTPLAGKLRNSLRLNQPLEANSENSSDGFKGSIFGANINGGSGGGTSGTNSGTEDSVGSDGSLVSSLTGSTVLTSAQNELGSQSQPANSSTSLKRSLKNSSCSSSGVNSRPSKRFRQNSSNSLASTSNPYSKRPAHSKHRSKIVPSKFRNSSEESRPIKKQFHRNDAPDKLWPFVEQFCATPTDEQITELEEMIKSMDNDKDYYKVPTLGKKESSNKSSTEQTPTKQDNTSSSSNTKSQRKTKSSKGEEETGLGALTQRLVSSFIEDSDGTVTEMTKSTSSDASSKSSKKKNSKTKGGKNIDINHAKNLEKRIRQELEEYDILDHRDEIPYASEDDEILRDLVVSQHELLSIQRQNKESMLRLLKRAKKHLELENEREKLRDANTDVIAAYHKLIQAKQRKRNPTKREKDAAWKALKVQEAIFKRCDDLYLSGLSRSGTI